MDDLDNRLLAALRRDGRASLSELAHDLGVTRTTVRARIGRMAASGEIAGFTVLTRADVAASPVRGLMMVSAEARVTDRVMARIVGLPEVVAVHSTNGAWDLIVEIGTGTLEAARSLAALESRACLELMELLAQVIRLAVVWCCHSHLQLL